MCSSLPIFKAAAVAAVLLSSGGRGGCGSGVDALFDLLKVVELLQLLPQFEVLL